MKNVLAPIIVLILIVSLFTFVIWNKRSSDSVDDSAEPSGYPGKPITYVVCFNPGGESDITARLQQKLLEDIVGVPIVITYKQGGGGVNPGLKPWAIVEKCLKGLHAAENESCKDFSIIAAYFSAWRWR